MAYKWTILDTNAILRLIINDVPEQRLKVRDLISRNEHYFFIPDMVISECLYVLQSPIYKYSREDAVHCLKMILGLSRIDYNEAVLEPAFELFLRKKSLSFIDCYLKAFAEDREMGPVWTFDNDLVKNGDGVAKLI